MKWSRVLNHGDKFLIPVNMVKLYRICDIVEENVSNLPIYGEGIIIKPPNMILVVLGYVDDTKKWWQFWKKDFGMKYMVGVVDIGREGK